MADYKVYPCTDLSQLSAIDGAALIENDWAIVVEDGEDVRFYRLSADSGESTSSPDVIAPGANAGQKRWLLQTLAAGLLNTHKSSGDHDGRYYTKAQNNSLLNTHKSSGDHDGRYYTQAQNNSLLNTHKSSGDHDERYNARRKGQIIMINSGSTPKAYLSIFNDVLDWRCAILPIPSGLHVESGGIISLTILDNNGEPPDNVNSVVNEDVIIIIASTKGGSTNLKLHIDSLVVYGS